MRRGRVVAAALLLVVPLSVLGCCKGIPGVGSSSGDGGAAATGSSGAAPTAAAPPIDLKAPANGVFPAGAADQILPKGGAPIVRLISPGAEPRTPLRYALTPGSVTSDTTLDVTSKAAAISMAIPRITMTYDYVVSPKQGAQWPVVATLKATKVDGGSGPAAALASMLRPKLKGLEGLTFTYQQDDRGKVSNMKSALADRRTPELEEILRTLQSSQAALSLALPEEPIGKGGKWQIITRAPDSGIDILQEVVCTLTDRKANAATIDMTIRQFAASDQMMSGNKPATIKSFDSDATMHTDGELTAVVPRTATMKQEFKVDAGKGAIGAVNNVTMKRR